MNQTSCRCMSYVNSFRQRGCGILRMKTEADELSMPDAFRQFYLNCEGKQSIKQLCLSINPNQRSGRRILASIAERLLSHAPESSAGSGMVQSRVSFSADCHSLAQADSDQSTTPASFWGQDPSSPRPKQPRSICQNAR
jgi:hypothetical protein